MRKILLPLAALALAIPATGSALEVAPTERSDSDVNFLGLPLDQVSAGFGVGNYTGNVADDIGAGTAWNVGADLDVSRPIDLELNYVGGYNSFTADSPAGDSFNLYTNGLQVAAQVEPWTISDAVTPYVSGGLGLTRLSVAKDTELNQDFQSDTAGAIPLALGADIDVTDNVVVGARAQWDVLFDNELMVEEESTDSDRTMLMVKLGITDF